MALRRKALEKSLSAVVFLGGGGWFCLFFLTLVSNNYFSHILSKKTDNVRFVNEASKFAGRWLTWVCGEGAMLNKRAFCSI